MDTLFLDSENKHDIELAGKILRDGGLVAVPTETVYGLAANALDPEAVKRIYITKGRPGDNPLIVHICDFSQIFPLVREVPLSAAKLAGTFWPGPLTIILPKSDLVPKETSGGLDTVAIRFPSHPAAQEVIRAAGVPLAAPSANLSGRPSPTRFDHVKRDLAGKVEALLDGGDCGVGVESTVLTLAGDVPRLLRPGGVTLEQIQDVLGEVEVDPAVLNSLEGEGTAPSPGMKYKHYAPKADVVLVDASPYGFTDYANSQEGCHALCFNEDTWRLKVPHLSYGSRYNGEAQAHELFSALMRLDEMGAKRVLAHMPSKRGVGLAVYNRLIRAAGFRTVVPENPVLVGLTGPSGAGKSTVANLLHKEGWAVVDCDALTRNPHVYNEECIRRLRIVFGDEIAPGGVLDRKALARRAFGYPNVKKNLEEVVFPFILQALDNAVVEAAVMGYKVVVADAPTLFEAGLDYRCARIITVIAPREERLRRIELRDGLTESEAERRFSAQKDDSFYTAPADWVIKNAGDGEDRLLSALEPILQDPLLGG